MARKSGKKRATFRHGNLPAALIVVALGRLETDGAESLSLRELARAAGVNHRAVYRHFPDKLSLLAAVAREGWLRLTREVLREKGKKKRGEAALVAEASGFFRFAAKNSNLFHLMAGPRLNQQRAFPELEEAITKTMRIFAQGFIEAGVPSNLSRIRTLIFVAALTGVVVQILYRRVRVSSAAAQGFVAEAAKRLIKGLR